MLLGKGKVFFVGAGPGDPELIPLKSVRAIANADVIIYDRLVPIQLLKHTKPGTRFLYCGKEAGNHSKTQEQINAMIIKEAKRGCVVVRLKGGDPGIFGRVGEEAEICAKHQIPFEVIPGITSGIAAAAYAGIPLTHRELSSSLAFISGHRSAQHYEQQRNWSAVIGFDTIVVYMGVKELPEICKQLLLHGKEPSTPVAIVRWATTGHQQTFEGTLNNIVDIAKHNQLQSPALMIIGDVVKVREFMNWYEPKKLFGRKILLFKDPQSEVDYVNQLVSLGAEVADISLSFPMETKCWNNTHAHSWNIFAEYMKEWDKGRAFNTLWVDSEHGIEVLEQAVRLHENWGSHLHHIPDMICVGEKTAALAKKQGWNVTITLPNTNDITLELERRITEQMSRTRLLS